MAAEGAAWDELLTKYADHPAIQRIDAAIENTRRKLDEDTRRHADMAEQLFGHLRAADEHIRAAETHLNRAATSHASIFSLIDDFLRDYRAYHVHK